MKNWQNILYHHTFRYLDHTNKQSFHNERYSAMTSFAIDDALTLSVSNKTSAPTLRLWNHPKTIVLGIPDTRLPYIEDGVKLLTSHGYEVIVRNSGGLAVALDDGVLNMSLVLTDMKDISIHDSYHLMFHFVKHILNDLNANIEAYEIIGSYCPGDYDLSIRGVKFAGISQRRIRDGIAIQIYIDIEGNSNEKAQLIQKFYHASLKGEKTRFSYPEVKPQVMGSLTELTKQALTVNAVKKRTKLALAQISKQVVNTPLSRIELAHFDTRLKQMKKRNEKIALMKNNLLY